MLKIALSGHGQNYFIATLQVQIMIDMSCTPGWIKTIGGLMFIEVVFVR